jgi:hypothetical protein
MKIPFPALQAGAVAEFGSHWATSSCQAMAGNAASDVAWLLSIAD